MTGETLASAGGRQCSEDVGFWSYPAPSIRTVKRGLAIEVKTYSLLQGRAIRLREKGACAFHLAMPIYLHKLAKFRSRFCCLNRTHDVPSFLAGPRSTNILIRACILV